MRVRAEHLRPHGGAAGGKQKLPRCQKRALWVHRPEARARHAEYAHLRAALPQMAPVHPPQPKPAPSRLPQIVVDGLCLRGGRGRGAQLQRCQPRASPHPDPSYPAMVPGQAHSSCPRPRSSHSPAQNHCCCCAVPRGLLGQTARGQPGKQALLLAAPGGSHHHRHRTRCCWRKCLMAGLAAVGEHGTKWLHGTASRRLPPSAQQAQNAPRAPAPPPAARHRISRWLW